nr:hypothetical protein [Nocardia sp. XZ_19_369]
MARRQTDIAAELHVTPQALHLYETAQRPTPPQMVPRWCAVVEVPIWQRPTLIAMAKDEICHVNNVTVETWPPPLTELERTRIDVLNVPAWYLAAPAFDILHANPVAEATFPWAMAPVGRCRPTNLLEQMLLDQRARESIANWETISHAMVSTFRLFSPGVVPVERITQIVQSCSAHPKFARMWNTDVDDRRERLVARHPHDPDTYWTSSAYHEAAASAGLDQGTHELLMLTPSITRI